MQKTQNRWYVISLSITSRSLQQLRRYLLSSQNSPWKACLEWPWLYFKLQTKTTSLSEKGTGKPMQGLRSCLLTAFLKLRRAGGSRLPAMALGGDLDREGRSPAGSRDTLQPKTKVRAGSPGARGRQLADPAWNGTQGWMVPTPAMYLNTPLGQHTSNKQPHVKTKQFTYIKWSCSDLQPSQGKIATTKKDYFSSNQTQTLGCNFHTHLMAAFLCKHRQRTDLGFSQL